MEAVFKSSFHENKKNARLSHFLFGPKPKPEAFRARHELQSINTCMEKVSVHFCSKPIMASFMYVLRPAKYYVAYR